MTQEQQNRIYQFIVNNAFQIRLNDNSSSISKSHIKKEDVPNISYLHFWNKNLEYLIEEIALLPKLKTLKLPKNKLQNLPESFKDLILLEELDISENYFSEFPKFITTLKCLHTLKINNNNLKYLPEEIVELNLNDFDIKSWVQGNDFIEPSEEIICEGLEALKIYFEDMKEETRQVNEIKVLFIGDGGAGKTSLINRLVFDTFDSEEKKTNGIVKQEFSFDEIKANFWDFGGQTIYHSTHQFFLSQRSIYILVLDGRKEQEEEYWLKMIKNFGGNSRVLVVLNKIDDNHHVNVDEKFLKSKYPNIIDFIKISCKDNHNINLLKDILKKEIKSSEILKEELPKSWFDTKEKLENMTEDFLDYDSFEKICLENKVKKESQNVLIKFLHDLGVILNFNDNFVLKNLHIINPDWATEGVYQIINSKQICDEEGLLNYQHLDTILDLSKYPRDKHISLIELMKKFEICFEKDESFILIPELLPKNEPDFSFNESEKIHFRIKYDFLPKAAITRFIVNEHNIICNSLVWRKGVVLEEEKLATRAIVREDRTEKRIDIYVFGNHKRELLSRIRATFNKINENFKNNNIVEQILLPDNENIPVSFEHLLYLESINETTYYPEGAKQQYQISSLLDGFIKKEERKPIVQNIIQGDHYESVTQVNQSSGSIGGSSIDHSTSNINIELKKLIKEIDKSSLSDKLEIIDNINKSAHDTTKIQKVLGALMTRGAEVMTLMPHVQNVFNRLF